jgi:hypothetical protein
MDKSKYLVRRGKKKITRVTQGSSVTGGAVNRLIWTQIEWRCFCAPRCAVRVSRGVRPPGRSLMRGR